MTKHVPLDEADAPRVENPMHAVENLREDAVRCFRLARNAFNERPHQELLALGYQFLVEAASSRLRVEIPTERPIAS
jgi:hypothetical protein